MAVWRYFAEDETLLAEVHVYDDASFSLSYPLAWTRLTVTYSNGDQREAVRHAR